FPASPTTSNKARSRRQGTRTSPGKPARNRSEKARIVRSWLCYLAAVTETHPSPDPAGFVDRRECRAAAYVVIGLTDLNQVRKLSCRRENSQEVIGDILQGSYDERTKIRPFASRPCL